MSAECWENVNLFFFFYLNNIETLATTKLLMCLLAWIKNKTYFQLLSYPKLTYSKQNKKNSLV